jgi:tRNA(Ile)-lysidine synthase TilS/MesJ
LGLLSLFGTLVPFDYVAHAAHLGGILVGIAYVRWGEQVLARISNWRVRPARHRKQELVRAASVRGRPWRSHSSQSNPGPAPEEFISKEVDPILDKISAHGIQSLTEQERKVLDAARKKMSKR